MANYTLTAEIVPELAAGFSRQIQTQMNNSFRQATPTVNPNLNTRQLTRQASQAGDRAGKSFSSAFAAAAKAGVLAAGAGIAAGLGFGLKIAAQNEQAQISFETMLGSAEKATVFLNDLKKFAATTPFEFPELQTAASSLISVGIDAKKVIPIMTNLGNATSGMGTGAEGVKRATVALQQMSAAGKITGEDLNQLRDAGVPVFDILAKSTGKTKEQLADMAAKGKLGRKELDALMKGIETGKGFEKFTGLMDKQSQSLSGMVSTLKDTVGQGLADLLTPALPGIKRALEFLSGMFATAFEKIPGIITNMWNVAGPIFKAIGTALVTAFNFIRENQEWLKPLAVAILAAAAAFKAWQLATAAWAAITKIATGIQLGFNAAMKANTIGIIIAAITALVVALVWAYKKFPAFRAVVDATFRAIATAAQWLWNTVLKPIWQAIKVGFQALATAVGWYWNNVLKPVFSAYAAVVMWLWNNVLKPAWAGIQAGFKALVTGIQSYWNNVLKPLLNGIATVAKWLWNNVFKPVWAGIKEGFRLLVEGIKAIWNNVLKPVFDAIKSAVGTIKTAFKNAVDGIKVIWDKLKSIAAVPVNFVIESVYNNGIRKVWNWIAEKVGLGQLGEIAPVKFAKGGVVPGKGNGDTVPAMLTPGEGILTKAEMEALGGTAGFARLRKKLAEKNKQKAKGDDSPGPGGIGDGNGFFGDAINWIKDKGKNLWEDAKSAVRGALSGVTEKLIQPIRDQINGADMLKSGFGPLIKAAPIKILDKIIEFVKGDDEKNADLAGALGGTGGGTGMGWQKQMQILRAQFPGLPLYSGFRPGSITSTGNRSYHSMGRAVDIPPRWDVFNWLRSNYGKSTRELIFTPAGNKQIKNGQDHVFSGGTIKRDHYNHVHWAMDQGGMLQPGWNPPIWNGTKKPEPVLTSGQWKSVRAAASGMGNGAGLTVVEGDNYIEFGDIHSDVDMNMAMERITRLTRGAGY